MYYEAPPPSFLETPGAREVGIEFHSLSKTYNMTGWRIGLACGNATLVGGLGKVKTNVDSGAFEAVQARRSRRCPAIRRAWRGSARSTASGATCCAAGSPRRASTC